jgi:hypothetical protein
MMAPLLQNEQGRNNLAGRYKLCAAPINAVSPSAIEIIRPGNSNFERCFTIRLL